MLRRLRLPSPLALATAVALTLTPALSGPALAQDSQDAQDSKDAKPLRRLQAAIESAARRVADSVVLIHVEREGGDDRTTESVQRRRLGMTGQNPAEGYFSRPDAPVVGVVFDDKGTILTTRFNVTGGTIRRVWVVGPDGRKRKAKLLGSDPNLDVAALKVEDSSGLKVAPRGDSSKLEPGRMAILVGRSEGSAWPTVGYGLVSAVDRLRKTAFQVSARMNYGNTGGAVVDLHGRLVGLAAHVTNRAMTGQNSGVGFAAPVHLIERSLPTMLAGNDVPRIKTPFMGIQGDQRQPEGVKGTRIVRVLEGTAAARAGLKAGDIITIFNGTEVDDFMTLAEEIQKLSVGDRILVTVVRDGWEKELTIKLGARPEGE